MIGSEGTFSTLNGEPVSSPIQTLPYGTGLFCKRIPGSELPGYLHPVPPGRNPARLYIFDSTSHQPKIFEDEDDDEYEDDWCSTQTVFNTR